MLPGWSFLLVGSHGHEDAPTQFWFCDGTDTLWTDWKHFLPFFFAFEGWEAADRRSHPADWRDQRARNDQ